LLITPAAHEAVAKDTENRAKKAVTVNHLAQYGRSYIGGDPAAMIK